MFRLRDINKFDDWDVNFLYSLLEEREKEESISHKSLPHLAEHTNYIQNIDHKFYWIIEDFDALCLPFMVGSAYISKNNDIGIAIKLKYRRLGYGTKVLKRLSSYKNSLGNLHANINPANEKSIRLFEKVGFVHIQNTYRLD